MSSRDSYQCSSMDDDDDELEGNSPTSMWRRNRKRKDYSDDEDYEEEVEKEEEEEEEEEGEYKPFANIAPLATAPPSPIPVAGVKVNVSLGNKRQSARMSTGGKVPKHALASKNVVSTLIGREFQHGTKENYPGEWDRKIPNVKVPSPEWKPCQRTVGKSLMEELGKTVGEKRILDLNLLDEWRNEAYQNG